jgi:hypothetical protein
MTARPSSLLLPGAFALAAALAAPREGAAIPFARRISLHAELSAGTVIAAPDGYPYDFGMLATGRFNLLLGGPVRLQLSAVQGIFPSSQRPTSVNNNYMLGLRFAPRTVRPEGRLFVDAEAGLAISGFNWRPGFDIGVGWEIAVSRYLHLGPVLRYSHIYQPDDEPAPEDARYITLGLSFAIYPSPPPGPRSGSLVAIGLGNDEDRDYDGVPDELDQCIDVVEDHDGFQDEDGCPDLDDDHDGLPDSEDRCPRAAETANGFEDEDGCPDTPPETQEAITLEGNQIRLRQRVYFGNNRVQVPAVVHARDDRAGAAAGGAPRGATQCAWRATPTTAAHAARDSPCRCEGPSPSCSFSSRRASSPSASSPWASATCDPSTPPTTR